MEVLLPETSCIQLENLEKIGDYLAKHILTKLSSKEKDTMGRPYTPKDK